MGAGSAEGLGVRGRVWEAVSLDHSKKCVRDRNWERKGNYLRERQKVLFLYFSFY